MNTQPYKAPSQKTEYAVISVHNREALSPDHAWIITEKKNRDTLTFLEESTTDELRDVFQSAAKPSPSFPDAAATFVLLHAVRAGDEVQHTNSKLPNLHIHAFTAGFSLDYSQITDPKVKSYTVQPNPNLDSVIKASLSEESTDETCSSAFKTITLNKSNGGEVNSHGILVNSNFSCFGDFAEKAKDGDWEGLREGLVGLIQPWAQKNQGGCRIIINESDKQRDCFTVEILAGENLDRSGANKQRYFEQPASVNTPPNL
jgi:hypothetical protein